ncbi:MAG: hypothetical protein WEE89_16990 [Gemmatimonadota bacterium]
MIRQSLILIAAGATVLGCGGPPAPEPVLPAPGGVVCTMEARPAITVEPVDATTGQSVSQNATVIAMAGSYADTASVHTTGVPSISAAYERPGTYTVLVRHPDYREWRRSGVVATKDECHVQTIRLRAELEKR